MGAGKGRDRGRCGRGRGAVPWPLVVAAVLGAPSAVSAQAAVRGILYDSLRSQGPIAGAEVVLLGAGARAITDSEGGFTFRGPLADGDTVAYWAPWLDSLGVPAVKRVVRGDRAREPVTLATPSLESLLTAHCGAPLSRDQAAALGELTDEVGRPRAGWQLAATWTDVQVDGTRIAEQRLATVDTTTLAGGWVLCGLPLDATVTVVATGPRGEALTQSLQVHSRLLRRDLVHGSADARVVVRGRVTTAAGAGIANARVTVGGSDSAVAVSDANGRFATALLPARSTDVVIRAIGFAPTWLPLSPRGGEVEVGEVTLAEAPYELEARRITEGPFAHERRGFEERRSVGLGFFVTDDMLRHVPVVSPVVVYSLTPRLRLRTTPAGPALLLRKGPGACSPRFFVDGADEGTMDARDQALLLERAKRLEIYTAAQAPPRYNDFDGCGSIVVWTR